MKGITSWSFDWYRPPVNDGNRVYICQVIPSEGKIYLAYKSDLSPREWQINYRKKSSEDMWQTVTARQNNVTISSLDNECDYEFYVCSGELRSAVGYARTGECVGRTVNYLHPDDPKYSFSGQHLCTPSILKHPDGYMLASMDVYEGKAPQNLTLIFRSDDDGENWYHYTELFPCFWGKLFLHDGYIYMLGVSTEYGDLLIGRSTDGGKHFCTPTVIHRGSCASWYPGWHKSAMPLTACRGRLWTGVDYGSHKTGGHATCLLSVPENADLLDPENWSISEPLSFDPGWEGAVSGDHRGFIEDNAVVFPDGEIGIIARYLTDLGTPAYGLAGLLRGNADAPEEQLKFYKFVGFSGNLSKFDVLYDEKSRMYCSIINSIRDEKNVKARNVLSFAVSTDLENWTEICDLLDCSDKDASKTAFQYVSFAFDGDDIIYLSRTAFNNAQNYHDNNYITFHRIKNFRELYQ